jgi:YfiH family protein
LITCLTAGSLGFPHGFFGRTGGVSLGLFESLNMGLGSFDDVAHVHENRLRARDAVAPSARLVTLHQVHSARAVKAGDWPDDARPEADGLVTDRPGLALGILTADCAPLLFEDAGAGVIGACHAGWRGAFTGVIGATVDLMERLGARRDRIAAAVGPCIGRRSYEVDDEFRPRFEQADPDNGAFVPDGRTGPAVFDLEGFCLKRLAEAGVARAEGLGADTMSDPVHFFSYRRKTLAGEPDYGRQISLIALPG